jgi:hypothetical protein
MPIKLDWRFDALDHVARVHIKELWDFYDQAQKHFQTAMKAWEDEGKDLNEEEEAVYADYFIEKRDSIEALLDRGHTLGVVAVYTFLERFLNLVLEHLRAGGAPIPLPESKQGFTLNQMRAQLESLKIGTSEEPIDWDALNLMREIRNCIVHTDGWITEDFVDRLKKVGFKAKEDTRLVLPDRYFERCWNLVNSTCQRVHAECWKQFGYGKQHELWLKPSRKFTSDEVRGIIAEAVAAAVAAHKQAKAGREHEGSCGFAWIELDPKLLKHIHKLEIPGVGTSYNTTAIVDTFNLYLEEVRDYMDISAAIAGMEAAVEIFKKHGINAVVHSLAD